MDHYEFITKTDKKSLFNQIKYLVESGQKSYQDDLAIRKDRIRELLEEEEKIYEDEFIEKIKSRVDENIRERKKSLLAMKEERMKENKKFVAAKKLHQNMLNCLEIRDELRKKDNRETQLCQLEQIDEKHRALQRQKKDEEFWLKVQKKMEAKVDRSQKEEDDLKKSLQAYQCRILGSQVEEHRKLKEMDIARLNKERNELSLQMQTSQGEEHKQAVEDVKAKNKDAKMCVNTVCEQQRLLRDEAETFENVFHEETMRQVNKEIEESLLKNFNFKKDTLDYLKYIKKFKSFVSDQDRKREEMADELDKRFNCFKKHQKKSLGSSKRQTAESTHRILLKQICEEQARRLKLEAAERENKMPENRFARVEVYGKLKERLKVKKDLDDQLKEINRWKIEKQKQFENELKMAAEDQFYCEQLLEKYKIENCDYLPPHPNWRLLACFKKNDDKN